MNLGYKQGNVWIRFSLENKTQDDDLLLLEFGYSLIDSIKLYVEEVNSLKLLGHQGDSLPFSSRKIKTTNPIFSLDIQPNEKRTYYIEINSTSSLSIPIHIATQNTQKEHLQAASLGNGTFYGMILALLGYNLFVFFSTKDMSHLYYVFLMLSYLFFWGTIDGISFQYIWPNSHILHHQAPLMFLSLVNIFALQFARYFLDLIHAKPKIDKLFRYLIGLQVLNLFTLFLMPIHIASSINLLTVLFNVISIIYASCIRLIDGYKPAKYFIIAWSLYLISVAASIVGVLNLIPFPIPYYIIVKGSSGMEFILLSLALADMINTLKEEKMRSHHSAQEAFMESKAKSDFLAKMSHEIRTPMNGVLGMAELLKGTTLDDNQNHYLDIIRTSGQALLKVINDILDLSKIEAGKMEIESIAFDLRQLVEEALTVFALTAYEKRIELLCIVDPDTPMDIYSDPTRIRQIIINLVGNALKFTEQGEVKVIISAEFREDKPAIDDDIKLCIKIVDSGVGISKEGISRLFKDFSQAEKSTGRIHGGTGLGLSISKQLVTLMGGEINIESELGTGTTFQFTLAAKVAPTITKPLLESSDVSHLRALVIDDHESVCLHLCQSLGNYGVKTDYCLTATAALDKLQKASAGKDIFNVLFIDYYMPGITGIELCRKLQGYVEFRDLKIVLISAARVVLDVEMKRELGIINFLYKPISANRLEEALVNIIGKQIKQSNDEKAQLLDTKFILNTLIAEDNKVNQMVIEGMLKKLGVQCTLAENGEEALEYYRNNNASLDLVLMDCEMPVMDGYQATKKIREFEELHNLSRIPIFALSAHVMAEQKTKAFDVGMDEFLMKPIKGSDLVKILNQYFKTAA